MSVSSIWVQGKDGLYYKDPIVVGEIPRRYKDRVNGMIRHDLVRWFICWDSEGSVKLVVFLGTILEADEIIALILEAMNGQLIECTGIGLMVWPLLNGSFVGMKMKTGVGYTIELLQPLGITMTAHSGVRATLESLNL